MLDKLKEVKSLSIVFMIFIVLSDYECLRASLNPSKDSILKFPDGLVEIAFCISEIEN